MSSSEICTRRDRGRERGREICTRTHAHGCDLHTRAPHAPSPKAQSSTRQDLVERALSSLEEAEQLLQREELHLVARAQLLEWRAHEVGRQVPQPLQSGRVAHEHCACRKQGRGEARGAAAGASRGVGSASGAARPPGRAPSRRGRGRRSGAPRRAGRGGSAGSSPRTAPRRRRSRGARRCAACCASTAARRGTTAPRRAATLRR